MKPLLLEKCLGNHPNILLCLVPVNQNSSDALSTFYLPKLEVIYDRRSPRCTLPSSNTSWKNDLTSDRLLVFMISYQIQNQFWRISKYKEGNFILFMTELHLSWLDNLIFSQTLTKFDKILSNLVNFFFSKLTVFNIFLKFVTSNPV